MWLKGTSRRASIGQEKLTLLFLTFDLIDDNGFHKLQKQSKRKYEEENKNTV